MIDRFTDERFIFKPTSGQQYKPHDIELLLSFYTSKSFKKDEVIIREGQVCNYLFYVEKGLAKLVTHNNDREFIMQFFDEGFFMSVIYSFTLQQPSSFELRLVNEAASREGFPVWPCNNFMAVPIGEKVAYRIPLVCTAWRFKPGHRLGLLITGDDQNEEVPVMMGFRHASVGTSCLSTIHSVSKLLLPVIATAK